MPELRPASSEELSEIWALVRRAVVHARSLGNPQWGDDYPTYSHYSDAADAGELYAAVSEGGAILGVAVLNGRGEAEYAKVAWLSPGPALIIHKLAVDPAAQRQGVGSAFFRLAEQQARRQGLRSVRVDTYSLNDRMQALILKQGYRQVGHVHYPGRELLYPCYEKVLGEEAEPSTGI